MSHREYSKTTKRIIQAIEDGFVVSPTIAAHVGVTVSEITTKLNELERSRVVARAGFRRSMKHKKPLIMWRIGEPLPVVEPMRPVHKEYETVTAELFGDPRPGCSALDQRNAK